MANDALASPNADVDFSFAGVIYLKLVGDTFECGERSIFVSDPSELILDAVARTFEGAEREFMAKRRASGLFLERGRLVWRPDDGTGNHLSVQINRDATVSHLLLAFGPLVTERPARLSLGLEGMGGDNDSFFVNLVDSSLSSTKFYKLINGVFTIADAVRFREHRHEVGEWQDTGIISTRLKEFVRAEPSWRPRTFERRFGVTGSERGALLRTLGYQAAGPKKRKVWVDSNSGNDDSRPPATLSSTSELTTETLN